MTSIRTKNIHGRVGVKRRMTERKIEARRRKRQRRLGDAPLRAQRRREEIERREKARDARRKMMRLPIDALVNVMKAKESEAPVVAEGGIEAVMSYPKKSGKSLLMAKAAAEAEDRGESVTVLDGDTVWLNVKATAEYIGRGETYVKQHAEELGGEKHALRWRFDQAALDRWKADQR